MLLLSINKLADVVFRTAHAEENLLHICVLCYFFNFLTLHSNEIYYICLNPVCRCMHLQHKKLNRIFSGLSMGLEVANKYSLQIVHVVNKSLVPEHRWQHSVQGLH